MIPFILAIALLSAGGALVWSWRRNTEAREQARLEVDRLRADARLKQEQRSAAIDKAAAIRRSEVESMGESKEARQALADMLNKGD